jgi:hypothetical protein
MVETIAGWFVSANWATGLGGGAAMVGAGDDAVCAVACALAPVRSGKIWAADCNAESKSVGLGSSEVCKSGAEADGGAASMEESDEDWSAAWGEESMAITLALAGNGASVSLSAAVESTVELDG